MFSLHGKIALITLAFLAIAAIGMIRPSDTGQSAPGIDIVLQHTLPLTIAISLTEGTDSSLVDMDLTSGETVSIDVPDDWKRTEVRRSPIASVTSETAPASATRWKLPANTGVSFSSETSASNVTVHNPSGVTVKIQLTRVNLAKKTSVYDVYLLKDGFLKLP